MKNRRNWPQLLHRTVSLPLLWCVVSTKNYPACHGTIGAGNTDYIDGVLVLGHTPEEARANALRVLSRLHAAGLRRHARFWKTRVFTLVIG